MPTIPDTEPPGAQDRSLHTQLVPQTQPQAHRRTRIVCISDTHNQTPVLPKGDILIHAGDLTKRGSLLELQRQIAWILKADFDVKIVVAGNHDIGLDVSYKGEKLNHERTNEGEAFRNLIREAEAGGITYLRHEARRVRLKDGSQFKVFGSPFSPACGDWAFGYDESREGEDLWSAVPLDVQIVVTHTPSRGFVDRSPNHRRQGCGALLKRLEEVKPILHVCGHIHEGRGVEDIVWGHDGEVENICRWIDPGKGEGNRKQSIASLLPGRRSNWLMGQDDGQQLDERQKGASRSDQRGLEGRRSGVGKFEESRTCVVNAAFMQNSWPGPVKFNKPIIVDIEMPVLMQVDNE